MGVGNIASLAVFCLAEQPFLAVTFHHRPETESVELDFGFSQGPVTAAAGFEETAGGAFVVSLDEGPLAARLAGRDAEVTLRVGSEDEGVLSLKGSSRTIRSAIGACHAFRYDASGAISAAARSLRTWRWTRRSSPDLQ